jgi:hypothetical protein
MSASTRTSQKTVNLTNGFNKVTLDKLLVVALISLSPWKETEGGVAISRVKLAFY